MRRIQSLRWRLVRTYLILIVVVITLFIIWAGSVLQNTRARNRKQELEKDALIMTSLLGVHMEQAQSRELDIPYLQRLTTAFGQDVGGRLLIVDAQGSLLADSKAEFPPLSQISDDGIAAILAKHDNLYVTVPIIQGTESMGTVHLAVPGSTLRTQVQRQWLVLIVPGIVVALVTAVVSLWLAGRILGPVETLTHAAQEIADGALDRRIPVDTEDELGEMSRAFNQMADRVAAMIDQQKSFVAHASHELRTPLTSIQLWVEALLGGAKDDPETATSFLNEIAAQTQRLTQTSDALLNLSRLESGLMPVEAVPTALPGFIDAVAAELDPQMEHKGHNVSTDVAADLPKVSLDPDQIRRVLINLLDNANRYTPPGGRISVVADWHTDIQHLHADATPTVPSWVRISVIDSGPGIPEDDLPHIFERFYRGQGARADAPQGSGLGLAMVKCIVETLHGGKVWAESRLGEGTTVSFALPLHAGHVEKPPGRADRRGDG